MSCVPCVLSEKNTISKASKLGHKRKELSIIKSVDEAFIPDKLYHTTMINI